jgi:hypothetical protein
MSETASSFDLGELSFNLGEGSARRGPPGPVVSNPVVSNPVVSNPVVSNAEQSLCVQCGLCCDGTIFEWARVFPEDDLAQLEADGFILLTTAARSGFALPCHHQQGRICGVYQRWRPQVCHTFRCALLRRVEAGEVAWAEALARIERAVALVERIQAQLPTQDNSERKSLKQRMADWQAAQTAAGIQGGGSPRSTLKDVQRTFAPLLLDFVSLQRMLDQHFRVKAANVKPKEESADDV